MADPTLYQRLKRIASPHLVHYRTDLTHHDRAICRKMRPGDVAIYAVRPYGTHFACFRNAEDTGPERPRRPLRLRSTVSTPRWPPRRSWAGIWSSARRRSVARSRHQLPCRPPDGRADPRPDASPPVQRLQKSRMKFVLRTDIPFAGHAQSVLTGRVVRRHDARRVCRRSRLPHPHRRRGRVRRNGCRSHEQLRLTVVRVKKSPGRIKPGAIPAIADIFTQTIQSDYTCRPRRNVKWGSAAPK